MVSLVGNGYRSEAKPLGLYTAIDRIKTCGGTDAFWGGSWSMLSAPAASFLPGLGVVAMVEPTVSVLVGALERAAANRPRWRGRR